MKVSIWDLDYYYAEEKVNCFNPDVMKISSYHKQLGDTINFVTTADDIRRQYDLYYIIKENRKTPNPPLDFFTNSKVRWWGDAYRVRVKWRMSDAMLGCRPDYLLYPEYNTSLERAEHIRLFNSDGKLLTLTQDYRNTFKRKRTIVTDKYMWHSDTNSLLIALKELENVKNVYFLNEISLRRLLNDKDLREQFLRLNFTSGTVFKWQIIKQDQIDAALEFLAELKKYNPRVNVGAVTIDYSEEKEKHWENKNSAMSDFEALKKIILKGKRNKVQIKVRLPQSLSESPYYYFFAALGDWTSGKMFKHSWLEYLTTKHSKQKKEEFILWNRPTLWNEVFRDLLRQTYEDREFLLHKWGNKSLAEVDVPWQVWEKEFKYGI